MTEQAEWTCARCNEPMSKCQGHARSDKFEGIKVPPPTPPKK